MLLFAGFFLTLGAFLFGCVLTQVWSKNMEYRTQISMFQAIMFNLSGNSKASPLCVPKHSSPFSSTELLMKFE